MSWQHDCGRLCTTIPDQAVEQGNAIMPLSLSLGEEQRSVVEAVSRGAVCEFAACLPAVEFTRIKYHVVLLLEPLLLVVVVVQQLSLATAPSILGTLLRATTAYPLQIALPN